MSLRCSYQRQVCDAIGGWWSHGEPLELEFDAVQFGDEVTIAYTLETLERLAGLGLTTEELIGCDEAATEAYWQSEREECRLLGINQRLGKFEAA